MGERGGGKALPASYFYRRRKEASRKGNRSGEKKKAPRFRGSGEEPQGRESMIPDVPDGSRRKSRQPPRPRPAERASKKREKDVLFFTRMEGKRRSASHLCERKILKGNPLKGRGGPLMQLTPRETDLLAAGGEGGTSLLSGARRGGAYART